MTTTEIHAHVIPQADAAAIGSAGLKRDAVSLYRTVYRTPDFSRPLGQLGPKETALASQIGGFSQIMSPLL
jgi:hypothetical protein